MKLNLDDENMHRYLRVYTYYKELIESGGLKAGTRLPSIRKCAAQLRISRTTVETAYMMLAAEGYIISRPQSGYYAAEFIGRSKMDYSLENTEKQAEAIEFDFASSNVDRDSFQFDLWRRYIKSALRQDERLLSYGEPQGEWELREELCRYLDKHRNVVCAPEYVVVGAGVQSLLHILCPMLKDRKTAIFYNSEFLQGRTIFQDYGFETCGIREILKKDASYSGDIAFWGEGSDGIASLPAGSLFYLTPSQMTVWGDVMHITERLELIREAFEKDILIVEDDYNSEFRYHNRPTPSLQGLSGGRNVIYLGTFSRLLLPSIRMSFMVLPPELLSVYKEKARFYNQTASKAEQIALCQFIRDGHLESQIRKTRKLYAAKAKKLCEEIGRVFGELAIPHLGEAGFLVLVEIKTKLTAEQVAEKAKKAGVAVRPLAGNNAYEKKMFEKSWPRLLLSCSTVAAERYEEALRRFKDAVF